MENGKRFDGSYFNQFGSGSPRTTAQNTNTGQRVNRVMTGKEYSEYKKARRESAKAERSAQHGESARRNEANLRGAYQKQKKKISKGLAAALVVVGVAAASIGGVALFNHFSSNSSDTAPVETPPPIVDTYTPASTPFDTGEALSDYDTLSNGVHYDYSHYLDYENKTTKKAYDYDMSACFGDEERTIDGINEIADRTPEALASYAYSIFNKEEKQALGIDGMTMTQIDEYMSDENNQDGGAKQSAILAKLNEVLREDGTTFRFYYENGTEDSNYVNWVDANQDGIMTPDEAVLGYSRRQRNHAPQVDIYRNGKKVLDLNMLCGMQPNYEINETPGDLPEFPDGPGDKHDDDGGGTPEEHHDDEGGGTPEEHHDKDEGGGEPEEEDDKPGGTPEEGGGEPEDDKPGDDDPGDDTPPGGEPGGTPEDKPEIKDPENLTRIDDNILDDIADDIGTGEVKVTPTEDVTHEEPKTDKPTSSDYQERPSDYTKPEDTFKPNEASQTATPVTIQQPTGGISAGTDVAPNAGTSSGTGEVNIISPENDYSQDRTDATPAPAPASTPAQAPEVQPDTAAQAAADAAERTSDDTVHTSDLGGMSIDDLLNS